MAKLQKNKRLNDRFKKQKNAQEKRVTSKETKPLDEKLTSQKKEPKNVYYKHYKTLLIIPLILLFVAIALLGVQYAQTGEFFEKGISLKGGSLITLTPDLFDVSQVNKDHLQNELHLQFPVDEFLVRTQSQLGRISSIEIETSITQEDQLQEVQLIIAGLYEDLTSEEVRQNIQVSGSTLGDHFFSQIIKAVILAFVFMGIVVFIQFRTTIPSLAIILAAFSNIIMTLAIINIMGMKLSTAGIAAFLMLIGYSIDTDILLSSRVLKRKDSTVYKRIIGAMKTGLTMNFTTIAAVGIALLVSNSETIIQIMTILFIGLLVDIVNTWLQNAGILRWYVEYKENKGGNTK
jgi:preprotein translocase subunit SecF